MRRASARTSTGRKRHWPPKRGRRRRGKRRFRSSKSSVSLMRGAALDEPGRGGDGPAESVANRTPSLGAPRIARVTKSNPRPHARCHPLARRRSHACRFDPDAWQRRPTCIVFASDSIASCIASSPGDLWCWSFASGIVRRSIEVGSRDSVPTPLARRSDRGACSDTADDVIFTSTSRACGVAQSPAMRLAPLPRYKAAQRHRHAVQSLASYRAETTRCRKSESRLIRS
jgi:hypothetical protein